MKNNLLFNQNFQLGLIKNIETIYEDFITEMQEDIEGQEVYALFSEDFIKDLQIILQTKEIKKYSPLAFYWTALIDNFVYISQLHLDISSYINKKQNKLFQQIEEEIFDFWNNSEHADLFKSYLDEGFPIEDCSLKIMPLLEDYILSFFYLQISNQSKITLESFLYRPFENIGDSKKIIHLKSMEYCFNIDAEASDIISIDHIDFQKKEIELTIDEAPFSLKICKVKNTALDFPEVVGHFKIISHDPNDNVQTRFKDALQIIKLCGPELFQLVVNFSKYFIPINEPGIVSYSMQSLPSFSSINVYERDFLDLIDDIVHENGHHYLNTILNQEELLEEQEEELNEDEKIYFSPWRKALRPIRGIYHGTFTFYFALKLFCTLKKSLPVTHEIKTILKNYGDLDSFINKINKRIVEEYTLLNMCLRPLEQAKNNKKITTRGMDIVKWVFELVALEKEVYLNSLAEVEKNQNNQVFLKDLKQVAKESEKYELKN